MNSTGYLYDKRGRFLKAVILSHLTEKEKDVIKVNFKPERSLNVFRKTVSRDPVQRSFKLIGKGPFEWTLMYEEIS